MTRCTRCHRPMKHQTESGLGPICAKRAASTVAPDLFGYDIAQACKHAQERIAIRITARTWEHSRAIRQDYERRLMEMTA